MFLYTYSLFRFLFRFYFISFSPFFRTYLPHFFSHFSLYSTCFPSYPPRCHFFLTAILHLGQLRFDTVTDLSGDSSAVRDQQPLQLAARLLGVKSEQLETALVRKKSLVIRGEVILKALSATQAATTRDAIARSIYKRVFEWALGKINHALHPHLSGGAGGVGAGVLKEGGAAKQAPLASCVGILDIFGFENVQCNSFEQLCINYSSEVLHKVS